MGNQWVEGTEISSKHIKNIISITWHRSRVEFPSFNKSHRIHAAVSAFGSCFSWLSLFEVHENCSSPMQRMGGHGIPEHHQLVGSPLLCGRQSLNSIWPLKLYFLPGEQVSAFSRERNWAKREESLCSNCTEDMHGWLRQKVWDLPWQTPVTPVAVDLHSAFRAAHGCQDSSFSHYVDRQKFMHLRTWNISK